MEIGLQSVANGSALKSFQKQNDFIVVENLIFTILTSFFTTWLQKLPKLLENNEIK